MKILHIIASADPRSGGPIEGLRLAADCMAEWGHESEIVTLDAPEAAFLRHWPHQVHGVGRWMKRYGYTPALARWVARHAARFDVALVHGLWNHASVGGGRELRRSGLSYLVFAHGMLDPWFRQAYPLKHLAKQAFWTLWQGRVLREARAVLFTTETEMVRARHGFAGHGYREQVVAFGSARPPEQHAAQQAAFRAMLPALAGRRYLLFLGRIHPKKGCDLLIEAFAAIARTHPQLDLVIAGPDQSGHKAALARLAERAGLAARVHWPGMVTGAAKWGAFRGAEAFVLPSHQENFAMAVAEALSCSCPVLISDKVNIWPIVDREGAGLVREDSLEGVRALLAAYLDLPETRRAAMRRAARTVFETHFSAERAAADLLTQLEGAAR